MVQSTIFFTNNAGYLHDAVLQWAYGVNKTIEQGYPPDDGFRITQNIINMTYEGITGTVKINHLGDRNPDQRYSSKQEFDLNKISFHLTMMVISVLVFAHTSTHTLTFSLFFFAFTFCLPILTPTPIGILYYVTLELVDS